MDIINNKPVQTIFNRLFLAGLLLGFLSGVAVAFLLNTQAGYSQFASLLYPLTIVVFSAVLFVSLRDQKMYWSELFTKDKTMAIGQAASISIFGTLLALTLFMASLYLIFYLINSSEWPAFKTELRLTFSNLKILILIGVSVVIKGFLVSNK